MMRLTATSLIVAMALLACSDSGDPGPGDPDTRAGDAGADLSAADGQTPDALKQYLSWKTPPPATATAGKPFSPSWTVSEGMWMGKSWLTVCPKSDPKCKGTDAGLDTKDGELVSVTTALPKGEWVLRAEADVWGTVRSSSPVTVKVSGGVDIVWVQKLTKTGASCGYQYSASWQIKDGTSVTSTYLRAVSQVTGLTKDSSTQSGGPKTYSDTLDLPKSTWQLTARAVVDGQEYQSTSHYKSTPKILCN